METKIKKALTKERLKEIVKKTISEAFIEPGSDRYRRGFQKNRELYTQPESPIGPGFTPEEEDIILKAANVLSKHLAFQPLSSALKYSITKMRMEENEQLS